MITEKTPLPIVDNIEDDIDDRIIEGDIVEEFARQLDDGLLNRVQGYFLLRSVVVCLHNSPNELEGDVSDDDLGEIPFGYELLPQDEEEISVGHSSETELEVQETFVRTMTVSLDESEKIPEETSELIKSIMSNIKLSAKSTPDWANTIPELLWMPRVETSDVKE
ncbi:hypothetical protein DFQ30_009101 [Apophysomyces sp. BC1015]|nr:hypothetical protein DFQ30_009101 [Apophysomyces sp. BC1015]KAG0173084.1 hypothetical protein DFQ29_008111 [Apophysomyces sp. BC1021]